jgi:pyruvate dehydrogenase E1 component alpha subunit
VVTAGAGASARAESLGIKAFEIDGNDVTAVDSLTGELIPKIRGGDGPLFLSARTYRLKGHTSVDPALYRDQAHAAAQWDNDPLLRAAKELRRAGLSEDDLSAIDSAALGEMRRVSEAADAAPAPELAHAFDDIQDIGAPVWEARP